MQLILEENGQTRRFKLKPGTLTVGSSNACTLTVASDDVADVHFELRISEEGVEVLPRKGVSTIKLGGVALKAPAKLAAGKKLQFGSAVMQVKVAPEASATPSVERKAGGAAGRPSPSKKSAPSKRASSPTRSGVKRQTRRKQEKSIPTWATLLLLLPLVAVGYKIFVSFGESTSKRAFDAKASYTRIEESLALGNFKLAAEELEKVDAQVGLEAEWITAFREQRSQLKQQNERSTRVLNLSLIHISEPTRPY